MAAEQEFRALEHLAASLGLQESLDDPGGHAPVLASKFTLPTWEEALLKPPEAAAATSASRYEHGDSAVSSNAAAQAMRALQEKVEALTAQRQELEAEAAKLREQASILEAEAAARERHWEAVDAARAQSLREAEATERSLRREIELTRELHTASEGEKRDAQAALATTEHSLISQRQEHEE